MMDERKKDDIRRDLARVHELLHIPEMKEDEFTAMDYQEQYPGRSDFRGIHRRLEKLEKQGILASRKAYDPRRNREVRAWRFVKEACSESSKELTNEQ
jgi:hypothetical protein